MNMKGQKVLEAVSDGPWFFVKLAPGRYRITAESAGQTQARQVKVGGGRLAPLYFYWSVE
jgi:hypothetical protein